MTKRMGVSELYVKHDSVLVYTTSSNEKTGTLTVSAISAIRRSHRKRETIFLLSLASV